MGLLKKVWVFICVFAAVMACGSAPKFPYKHYGVHPSKGELLGDKPENDKRLSECEPIFDPKSKKLKYLCILLFENDFYVMKAKYEEYQIRLEECEKSKP